MFHKGLVPDFGGSSLDTDPDFGRQRHCCGTIIDLHTEINPNKMVTKNYLRQRLNAIDRFYLKILLFENVLVP